MGRRTAPIASARRSAIHYPTNLNRADNFEVQTSQFCVNQKVSVRFGTAGWIQGVVLAAPDMNNVGSDGITIKVVYEYGGNSYTGNFRREDVLPVSR